MLYKPDPEGKPERYAVTYVGHGDDLSAERLARQCHRLVWLNPHKGDNQDFQPSTLGMMVVAPHVDLLLSGHDLHSLEELAALLPTLG